MAIAVLPLAVVVWTAGALFMLGVSLAELVWTGDSKTARELWGLK
jgi:hypothetical protein